MIRLEYGRYQNVRCIIITLDEQYSIPFWNGIKTKFHNCKYFIIVERFARIYARSEDRFLQK